MNSLIPFRGLVFAALFSAAWPAAGYGATAASGAEAGQSLVKRYSDAVVTIEFVASVSIGLEGGNGSGPPAEAKGTATGTVISDTGLVVTALSLIDPPLELPPGAVARTPGGESVKLEKAGDTTYKEVKIRLADGTRVPARIVLKDADMDLAFLAPETAGSAAAAHPFTFVDPKAAGEGKTMGDDFVLSRAPESLRRVPLVAKCALMGSVDKPRRLFIAAQAWPGCPFFDAQGAFLGIGSLRPEPRSTATGIAAMMFHEPAPASVVIPAAQIAGLFKQAATGAQARP